jgi:hypothetical protein
MGSPPSLFPVSNNQDGGSFSNSGADPVPECPPSPRWNREQDGLGILEIINLLMTINNHLGDIEREGN